TPTRVTLRPGPQAGCGAVGADGRLVREVEAPRPFGGRPKAHARPRPHVWRRRGELERQRAGRQVVAVLVASDRQGLAQPGGTAGKLAVGAGGRPTRPRDVDPLDDLPRPEEDGAGELLGATDDVRTPVHPVGEVDVEMAGGPEHHLVARRGP